MHPVARRRARQQQVPRRRGARSRWCRPRRATSKIMSAVDSSCMTSPFSRSVIRRSIGSPASAAGTIRADGRNVRAFFDRSQSPPIAVRSGVDEVARREVVGDRVAGDVTEGRSAVHPVRGTADHRGQLQLPVVLIAIARQGDIVVRPRHRRRKADEQVRRASGSASVHHGCGLGAHLVVRARVIGPAERDSQIDHVRAVVRPRLQDLPRFQRRVHGQPLQIQPIANPLISQIGQHRQGLVPVRQ